MNINNFFVADPFNEEHIKLLEEFENKNNTNKPVTTYLSGIRKKYLDSESFSNINKSSNELNIIVFTMAQNKIKDYCYIKGEKDRKVCELFFASLNSNKFNRPLIKIVSDYTLNCIGMEMLNVAIDEDENYLYSQLKNNNFEDIGKVNGKITFIKEKEEIKEMSKVM